jgi:tetratricopeptide (TPR) repeat protein
MTARTFSHYEIIEELGVGGAGVVYKAHDQRDGRLVALKVIPPELIHDPDIQERFTRECKICAQLDHPHITSVYETGTWGDQAYLAMEYLEGGSLQDLLVSQGRLESLIALSIAIQIADALAYAHRQGVVHRDIKPTNIMVVTGRPLTDADGIPGLSTGGLPYVKLADFGIAVVMGSMGVTEDGEVLGTPHYMSPEQAMGMSVDHRTDLFSLGCVLCEMVSGRHAFGGESDMTVVYSICSEEPVDLLELAEGIPVELDLVARKAMAKDPNARYRSALEMRGDLEAIRKSLVADKGGTVRRLLAQREPASLWGWRCPELVGRSRELGLLREFMERAIGGEGSVVLIGGEAGVGKTRLIEEIVEWGRKHGVRHLVGRTVYSGGEVPYQPFREAFRRYWEVKGVSDGESLNRYLAERAPHLAGRSGVYRMLFGFGAPESELINKDQVWDSLAALLKVVAEDRPLLLQIEEVHWADEATAGFLRYLGYTCTSSAVMVLATYRPEEMAGSERSPIGQTLHELRNMDSCQEIVLDRLGERETRLMVKAILGGTDLGEAFSLRVHQETEGNPFFVVELIDLLREDGSIVPLNGGWELAGEPETLPIPLRVGDLIRARLNRVDSFERCLLDAASVEGESFHGRILAGCLKQRSVSVLLSLRTLDEKHHLVHVAEDGYRFDHVKVRDVVYQGLDPEDRRHYHRLIGEQFEQEHGEREDCAAVIAHHFLEAGEHERAVGYLVRAGDHARGIFSNADALSYYGRAVELFGQDDARLLDLLKRRAEVLELVGRWDEAERDVRDLVERSHERGDRSMEAEGLDHLGRILELKGSYDEALHYHRSSLKMRRELGDRWGEAQSLNNIGSIYYDRGDYDQGLAFYEEALTIKREVEDRRGEAVCLNNIGNVHCELGDYDRALSFRQESLQIRREIGDRRGEAICLNNIGNVHGERGNYAEALRCHRESLEITREIGYRRGEAICLNNIGNIDYERGEYGEALRSYQESLEIAREIGYRRMESSSLHNIGVIYECKGELSEALRTQKMSLTLQREIGDRGGEAMCLCNMSRIRWIQGQYGQALEDARQALALAQELGLRHLECLAYGEMGCIRFSLGQWSEVRQSAVRSAEVGHEVGAREQVSRSHTLLCQLSLAQKDLMSARNELEQALELAQEIRNIRATLESLLGCGYLALAEGDLDKAIGCVQHVLTEAGRTGRPFEEAVAHLLSAEICRAQGEPDRALEEIWRCVDITRSRDMRELLYCVHRLEGVVLLERGNHSLAHEAYCKSVDVVEEILLDVPENCREAFLSQERVAGVVTELASLSKELGIEEEIARCARLMV